MRGKHAAAKDVGQPTGITPADAGKTAVSKGRHKAMGDHPRGCGENGGGGIPLGVAPGSPPRMRGKQMQCSSKPGENGITPADAGKTAKQLKQAFALRDHPRGCGENVSPHPNLSLL